MKKFFLLVLLLSLFSYIFFLLLNFQALQVVAKTPEELEKEIEQYTKILQDLENQEGNLNTQISLMTTQEKITRTKIVQTQEKIKVLESEIATLSAKIVRLDQSLDFISKVFLSRIVANYKMGLVDPLILLLSSQDLGEFLAKNKYLKAIQLHDRNLLLSMEETKINYDEQKQIKERIQRQLALLKKQLEEEKAALVLQLADRRRLLEETKGKEAEYQRLLAAALSEQETILKSMQAAILKLTDGTKVEKGKEIALIGNTGYPCCSTGTHLHFMITTGCRQDEKGYIKDCNPVNPAEYLKNIPVTYNKDVSAMSFKGDWDWPIAEPRITQEYGMSSWARTGYYGGKPHNGIDMINAGHIVRVPKEGILYRQSTTCGRCNGGCCATVNFVALDHGDGVYSWYWHVQ